MMKKMLIMQVHEQAKKILVDLVALSRLKELNFYRNI